MFQLIITSHQSKDAYFIRSVESVQDILVEAFSSTMQVAKYLTSLNSPQMRPKQFGLLSGSNQWHETKDSILRVTMQIMEFFLLRISRNTANVTASSFLSVGLEPSTKMELPSGTSRPWLNGHVRICFILQPTGHNTPVRLSGLKQSIMQFGYLIACRI